MLELREIRTILSRDPSPGNATADITYACMMAGKHEQGNRMNWEAIGAFGEVVGAVAVVVTLLYVARQIHQANAQTQARARYSFIEAYGEMNVSISTNRDVASIFRRGVAGEGLDEDERMQFFALVGQFLNTWSVLFDLHRDGLLPENQWTMVRKDIIAMMKEPGGRAFWEEVGRKGVHEAFREAVDEVLASGESSYKMR